MKIGIPFKGNLTSCLNLWLNYKTMDRENEGTTNIKGNTVIHWMHLFNSDFRFSKKINIQFTFYYNVFRTNIQIKNIQLLSHLWIYAWIPKSSSSQVYELLKIINIWIYCDSIIPNHLLIEEQLTRKKDYVNVYIINCTRKPISNEILIEVIHKWEQQLKSDWDLYVHL